MQNLMESAFVLPVLTWSVTSSANDFAVAFTAAATVVARALAAADSTKADVLPARRPSAYPMAMHPEKYLSKPVSHFDLTPSWSTVQLGNSVRNDVSNEESNR